MNVLSRDRQRKRRLGVPASARTRTRQGVRAVVAALVIHLCAGCVHLEQEILIDSDATAIFTYHYSVAADTFETVAAGRRVIEAWQGRQPRPEITDLNWFFNGTAAEQYFSGPGLKLERYRAYTKGGRRHVELEIAADDVRRALESGRFGEFALTQTDEGDFLFRADLVSEPEGAPLTPEQLDRLRALCDDLWLKLRVKVPTRIRETTATRSRRRSATWIFDSARNADFLERAPVIELSFSGKGLDWQQPAAGPAESGEGMISAPAP